jgi:excisionase family DNA binding protein
VAFLTVSEAAEKLRLSVSAVYALCETRVLAHSRFGAGRGRIRIAEADLKAYEEACRVETGEREGVSRKPSSGRAAPSLFRFLKV